jgi:hypothetical protein
VNYNSTGIIYAQRNCWNKNASPCAPLASYFIGNVDRSSPLCCVFERWEETAPPPPPDPQELVYELPSEGPPAPTPGTPAVSGLVAIVPNPFNPTTTIHYSLAVPGNVEIHVYDVAGRLVQELVNGLRVAGPHSVAWTGTDRRGEAVASGIYFVRMVTPQQVFTKKMVMLK